MLEPLVPKGLSDCQVTAEQNDEILRILRCFSVPVVPCKKFEQSKTRQRCNGYLMRKFEYEGAPLIMALVLGNLFENAFHQSLIISKGSFAIFFTRPISAVVLTVALLALVSPLFMKRRPVMKIND